MEKVTKKVAEKIMIGTTNEYSGYDHYIALDWSGWNMSIARISSSNPTKVKVIDVAASLKELKKYFQEIRGKKILTIEETTTSQWLYVELYEYIDRIVICDPYRNRLLSDGPKTDKIDAKKLCHLLISGLIKEVYHTTENIYELRKYISAYTDLIKMGVRLKNQKSAFLRQVGKNKKTEEEVTNEASKFVIKAINESIDNYETSREEYVKLFKKMSRKNKVLKRLISIPGIAEITAVKILAMIVDAKRFKKPGKFLAYCGLAQHEEMSGGRKYGKRTPRYNRTLKSAYKTAASAAIGGNNSINEYYEHLITNGVAEHNARHAAARYIAKTSLGVMKGEMPYQPYLWREKRENRNTNKKESTGN